MQDILTKKSFSLLKDPYINLYIHIQLYKYIGKATYGCNFLFKQETSYLIPGGILGLIFVGCVLLASHSPYPIIVYSVASNIIDHILVTLGQICNFRDPNLVSCKYFYELTHFLDWMKNTFNFIYSTKHSGTFANRKYEELSYPQKSEHVRFHI